MVGQASSTYENYKIVNPLINIRELIVLTFGLSRNKMTADEAYVMAKNLEFRIKSIIAYKLKNRQTFRNLLTKLVKEKVLSAEYIPEASKYVFKLTEYGEGEFDYIIHATANNELIQKFDEFQSLIELFW